MNEHLLMLGRFVRSPRTVGAVAPSSRALAEEMVQGLDLSGAANVVELGPGTGVVTRAIAERLGPDAHALAVDVGDVAGAPVASGAPLAGRYWRNANYLTCLSCGASTRQRAP